VTSILHLITGLDTGGTETTLVRLLDRLDRSRFANSVVSLTSCGRQATRLTELGIPVTSLRMRHGVPGPMTAWRVWHAIRMARPDIVQTWLYHADLLGAVVGPAAGARVVCWNIRCADLDPADHSRSLGLVLRALGRLSTRPAAIVVNSTAGRRTHERLGYRPRRWERIPNGFDTDVFAPSATRRQEFRCRLGVQSDTPLVGLVARFHPIKDHATFMDAAAIVSKTLPRVRFVMAGRGVDQRNKALCDGLKRRGLSQSTSLIGEIDDMPSFFPALDVAVCSSYSEAFPNVIAEAMACGVPCVATAVGDTSEIIGRTGFVVAARDAAALAGGIQRMLAMEESARRMLGREARERIIAEYGLDRAVSRYERLYSELGEAKACAA